MKEPIGVKGFRYFTKVTAFLFIACGILSVLFHSDFLATLSITSGVSTPVTFVIYRSFHGNQKVNLE